MTTGASNDIEQATDLARKMVCEWGMSETLGPLSFGKREEQIFLGREIAEPPGLQRADRAVEIDSRGPPHRDRPVPPRPQDPDREPRRSCKGLAEALLEYETLDGPEINIIIAGGVMTREKPAKRPPPASAKPAERKEKKKILDALEGLGKLGEPTKA